MEIQLLRVPPKYLLQLFTRFPGSLAKVRHIALKRKGGKTIQITKDLGIVSKVSYTVNIVGGKFFSVHLNTWIYEFV